MAGNFGYYEVLFRAFETSGKDELPLSELVRRVLELKNQPPELVERPRRYLLRQKIRSGVLFSSVLKGINELITHWARFPYYRRRTQNTARTIQPTLGRA
jgi:hypothetical protein